ncbi:N-acetyltransferase DgcN [Paremcibacter congregatus]|uniref:EBNA-1 nuclear protein n=1 Tax=Paremcibacter congregatus TaxID=2043170 RepID=A0A2G4YW83_9PROT|nr:N-acetyltransferase DgcN [Paremcibacter congregatus]PHZ86523.1 EBNA-1 nuclear protein [Paremcibacter congregatus]QDE26326.1 DUF1611 domain-containing protein [Paremcibacter congregatus]
MKQPYLLFLGSEKVIENAKTAAGIAYWRPEACKGQFRLEGGTIDLGLPDLDLDEAVAAGIKTLVIGIAPFGGKIEASWVSVILTALEKGLDVAAGLHDRLQDHPEISQIAKTHGRTLYDIRKSDKKFDVGTGEKRTGMRLLTVGTDCAVGKKYASLAIEKEMKSRGVNADYRATGQTGIFIAGTGISVDAVVADFISGAAETLSPANDADHWDIIEGQGSLYHPSYAGVTVGLMHGSQSDKLVLCHNASLTHMDGLPNFPIVDFGACMDGYLSIARLTNRNVEFAGFCINTSKLSERDALDYMQRVEETFGLPCCDPVRTGVAKIVDKLGF